MPMLRGANLNPRRKPSRRSFDSLPARMAMLRIVSRRHPLMCGGFDDRSGDGHASGQVGYQGPWMWERTIKHGQWAGPWRRVRWEDDA
ncbi:hypothetical protein M0638_07140 [Roseomonas sp. NAR14]|uniref:Uncharacterized protein n=1 Tax=Roseomonas acroporae TaxID=2937791 RepID=A0A9X1Y6P5_9PROT|nr:hypothetical protein [Roseomonas acroporae]MCK8784150.1 hypothetical protein [Roseomonas acroporae]